MQTLFLCQTTSGMISGTIFDIASRPTFLFHQQDIDNQFEIAQQINKNRGADICENKSTKTVVQTFAKTSDNKTMLPNKTLAYSVVADIARWGGIVPYINLQMWMLTLNNEKNVYVVLFGCWPTSILQFDRGQWSWLSHIWCP